MGHGVGDRGYMEWTFEHLKEVFSARSRQVEKSASAYIPFDQCTSIGGPATFLKNLKSYLDQVEFSYVGSLAEASLILFPISYDLKKLKKLKKRGGIICQRLDGIYYPGKHGKDYIRRNEKIKTIYTGLADHVIFQSEYSRAQCFDMFGPLPKDAYSIVINGVNTEIFYSNTDRVFNREQVCFCTTGNFRNADMLVPVIKALDLIRGDVDFVFHVVGPIRNEECEKLMDREYIVHHDRCDMREVSEILRQSDIFIYSHLNPPCPNSILEAIACGLPIVGYESGSMAELLPFSTDLLADAGGKLYNQLEDFKPETLAEKLRYSIENYDVCREVSLKFTTTYSMENCGRKYVDVIAKKLRSADAS